MTLRLRWLLMALLAGMLATSTLACTNTDSEDETTSGEESAADDGATDAEDDADSEDEGDDADEAEAEDDEDVDDGSLGSASNPIVISYVPSGEQEDIVTGAGAIESLLEEETGLEFQSNVATSYAAVVEAMGAGNAHVGFLNTFSYLLAHEKYEVRPILVAERFGTTSYASILITREDGDIAGIDELSGKKFCRPDALSTSGWIIPSVMLKAVGIEESDLDVVDAGGHDGVVTAVYNGDCDAGAVYDDARSSIEDEFPDVKEAVFILETSDDIPNDGVSVAVEIDEELGQRITDALMAIAASEEGAEALSTAYGIEAFALTDDTFYDDFRTTLDAAGVDVSELADS
jgi:phosphonate transport system substrate-binding protein